MKDTVIQNRENQEEGEWIHFDEPDSYAISDAVRSGREYFLKSSAENFWEMLDRAMKQRFTWKTATEKYVTLYRKTLK